MKEVITDLCGLIRNARKRAGYTQEKCAELLEITTGHLKLIEGGVNNPSVPLLLRMMRLLDFSVDGLVFPDRETSRVLHLDGIREDQQEALLRLADTMRKK